jgi:hypothetical protein
MKELLEEAKAAAPPSLSGMVVIAVGKPDDAQGGLRPCQVAVEIRRERAAKAWDKKWQIITARGTGWVRDFEEVELSGGQCDIKSKDGKKSRLFDFRIVPGSK